MVDASDRTSRARWIADRAEEPLRLYGAERPEDGRPWTAIEAARAWARGEITVGAARASASKARAAARPAPRRR